MTTYDAFISYRRDSGSETARLIKALLESKGKKIFLDVDELRTGMFDEKLLETISNTPDFIIVLSPGALDRCHQQDDWLKHEIEQALQDTKNIIPVFKDGFEFPKAESLPPSIRDLPRFNGVTFNHLFFNAFIDLLLERMVGEGKQEPQAKTSQRDVDVESRECIDRGLERMFGGVIEDALIQFQRSVVLKESAAAYYYAAVASALLTSPIEEVRSNLENSLRIEPANQESSQFKAWIESIQELSDPTKSNEVRENVKRYAKTLVEQKGEVDRIRTVFEYVCPNAFRRRPYLFWSALVTLYYLARYICGVTQLVESSPVVTVAQWIASECGLIYAYFLSRYYVLIYYSLKNQLEAQFRPRFPRWYREHIRKTLGEEPSGKGMWSRWTSWVQMNPRIFAGSFGLFVVGVVSCSVLNDYSRISPLAAWMAVCDYAVMCISTLYPVWMAVTSFLVLLAYSRLPLRPIASRINLYSMKKIVEMVIVLGSVILVYFAAVSLIALLAFKVTSRIDFLLMSVAGLSAMMWSLGMPLFLMKALDRAKVRAINSYAKNVDNAFDAFIDKPDEETLKRYNWFASNEVLLKSLRSYVLPFRETVIIVLLNILAIAIPALYIWAKSTGLYIDLLQVLR